MIVPCCTAYDMLLVCRMSFQDIIGVLAGRGTGPSAAGVKGKGKPVQEKWVSALLKRQVGNAYLDLPLKMGRVWQINSFYCFDEVIIARHLIQLLMF